MADKSKSNPLPRRDFTDIEKEKILAMKERVSAHAAHEWQLNEFYLGRWLISRNWNVDAAVEMFINSMKWRKENDVDNIDEWAKNNPEYDEYHACWPGRLTGPTKDGWIVSFECFGKIDPPSLFQNSSVEFRIKYNIWKMELLEKKRREKEAEHGWSTGIVLVADMSKLGFSHMSSTTLDIFRQITEINKANYPETLRKVYVINAPTIFNMLWKAVSLFLDPTTLAKTSVLGGDFMESLLESMDITSIPSNFGGKGAEIPNGGVYNNNARKAQFTTLEIPRSAKIDHKITIEKENSKIIWEFSVLDHDIAFSVVHEPDGSEIVKSSRYNSGSQNSGEVVVTKSGTYFLRWDNSYSWARAKTVRFKVAVKDQ